MRGPGLVLSLLGAALVGCGLVYDYSGLRLAPDGGANTCAAASPPPPSQCTSPNLLMDPDNCGRCGHGCFGGTCTNGRCDPVLLARVPAREIALAGDEIFYVSDSCFGHVPKAGLTDGGTCSAIPPAGAIFQRFALDETNAYITTSGSVLKTPRGGGALTPLLDLTACDPTSPTSPCGEVQGIAVDDTNVYVMTHHVLLRVGKDNDVNPMAPVPLAEGCEGDSVLIDGAEAFYLFTGCAANIASVARVPTDGSKPALDMATGMNCTRMAAWNDSIYTHDGPNKIVRIWKGAIGNQPPPALVANSPLPFLNLTADCESVFWTTYDSATVMAAIYKAPLSGGEPVELTRRPEAFTPGIAVDDTAIYFTVNSSHINVLAR